MPIDVTSVESELDELYQAYCEFLNTAVANLTKKDKNLDPRKIFNDVHNAGSRFFNKFESSLDDYDSSNINKDQATRKAEDTFNIVSLIFNHWKVIRIFVGKYNLVEPIPSPTSYASIQRVLRKFYPKEVEELKNKFTNMNLPTVGFDSKPKHSGWKKKAPYEIIIGLIILIISGILNFVYNDPTGTQFIYLKLIMAIGGSVTLMGLGHGYVRVKWTLIHSLYVVASGTIALFILLYFFNPPSPPDMQNNIPNRIKVDTTNHDVFKK